MKRAPLNIIAFCLGISFSACSTFYTRHYTRGVFYDGFAHSAQPFVKSKKSKVSEAMKPVRDSSQTVSHTHPEKGIAKEEKQQNATPEKIRSSLTQKSTTAHPSFSSPVLKKVLKPIHHKIQSSGNSDSVARKAAFYILALVLAVGIIVLAIYFLPAILIPTAATSAFNTILLLAAIVVVCVFGFLIYTLINTLIDLFKHKKTAEEPEF
jgi:cation transport ATPase